MNICIDTNKRTVWLAYEYFQRQHISENTLSNWSKRGACRRIYIGGRTFLDYDTIPAPTRAKLPSKEDIKAEYRQKQQAEREHMFLSQLQDAHSGQDFVKWIEPIRAIYENLKLEKVTEYARCASVFERILHLQQYNAHKGNLKAMHAAFNTIYPGKYNRKNRFCMAVNRARKDGILSVAVDKRAIIKRQAVYGDEYRFVAEHVLGHNKAYNITTSYDKFCEVCIDQKYNIPSFTWFKEYYRDNCGRINRNRYGESAYQNRGANYANIIPALNVGDQWQCDGWLLPFYCWKPNGKGGKEYFFRYTLFVVLDAHSRKIVGFDIAESENTECILRGLSNAVHETGILPFEIVSDNHSFNKTKEAGDLKTKMAALGVTWTVDSNPRRKAILERTFRMLGENHLKEFFGYIGGGIKSRKKNTVTQQELKDIYAKPENMLSYDQLCAIVCTAIQTYNTSVRKSLGVSPEERYSKSEQPHSIKVDEFTYLPLFHHQTAHKIVNGQITIRRGLHKYEYQLPAEYSAEYNGKQVGVVYASLEEIYLFDLKTDIGICSVEQKVAIHGALANQTQADHDNLMRNTGRIKGINTQIRKKRESLFDSANTINPNIYEAANKVTTPKDVLNKAAQTKETLQMLEHQSISIETITPMPVVNEMLDASLKPRKKEENKHPFSVKSNEIKVLRSQNI